MEKQRKQTKQAPMKRRQAAVVRPRNNRQAPPPAEKLSLGQLNHHLGYFLRRLQIWVFQDFNQMLAVLKLRPAQYSVLLIIEANPGRSQAAIGQTLSIERARLARLLHELERRKWISRRASGRDARSHSLFLTPQGEKALTGIKSLTAKHEAQVVTYVGLKRRKQLMDLLRDFG